MIFFSIYTTTPDISPLSLHDALPIFADLPPAQRHPPGADRDQRRDPAADPDRQRDGDEQDRKSTRLNSSHPSISYAVFCLKKKKKIRNLKVGYGNDDIADFTIGALRV